MKADDNRDRAVERLLRRSLEIGGNGDLSPNCLDAETFAAWTDGALQGVALEAVEMHVAGCARCQAMAAVMMRTQPPAPSMLPWWRRSLRSAWLVPLTAGAAAVALWAVVPNRAPAPSQPNASMIVPAEPAQQRGAEAKAKAPSEPVLADRLEARADAPKDKVADERRENEARDQSRRSTAPGSTDAFAAAPPLPSSSTTPTPPPSATPATAPPARPAAAAEQPDRFRGLAGALMKQETLSREIVSADSAVRWRLGSGGAIDRTDDGGRTWTRLTTGVIDDLTAGVSPSPSVCWVVGRNGTVLRSTDGRTWARVNIPEAADLVMVEALDAATAVVTTSDGRKFRTTTGGQTWIK